MHFLHKDTQRKKKKEKKSAGAKKQEVEPKTRYSPPSYQGYLQYDRGAIFNPGVDGLSVYFF